MYNLVIVPNNSQNFAVGHFKTLDRAKEVNKSALESIRTTTILHFTDDYGAIITIPGNHISYMVIIDVQGKAMAQIEAKIDEARANKAIVERTATDMELQLLSRFVQQPQQPIVQMTPQGNQSQPN